MKRLFCAAVPAIVALAVAGGAFAGDSKSFNAGDSGTFTVTPTAVPGVVLTKDAGAGRGSRIGRYTFVAQEFINLATFEITGGSFTITTSHGTIFGTYSGHAGPGPTPGSITYDVSGPITGGTGRFAGVTGTISYHGVGVFTSATTGTLSETITGTLSPGEDGDDDDD